MISVIDNLRLPAVGALFRSRGRFEAFVWSQKKHKLFAEGFKTTKNKRKPTLKAEKKKVSSVITSILSIPAGADTSE